MSHSSAHPTGASIGQVSQRTGIPIETLRFYDRTGLLGELPRTSGGHRVFDDIALGLLDVVVRLRRTGMPISDVREFVELARTDTNRRGRIDMLQRHRQRVTDQLAQLTADLRVIDWKIEAYGAAEAGEPAPAPPSGWPATTDLLPPPDDLRPDAAR